jgi:predicted regulator of Ras-like GTPase activity (Roadblock/LC7/MglB family)
MDITLNKNQVDGITAILNSHLINPGVDCCLLIDRSGNLLISKGDPLSMDTSALAALTAANFGATEEIARLIGEKNFTLLFHKGERENVHFSKVGEQLILITIFGHNVSLGLVRLKVDEAAKSIVRFFESSG